MEREFWILPVAGRCMLRSCRSFPVDSGKKRVGKEGEGRRGEKQQERSCGQRSERASKRPYLDRQERSFLATRARSCSIPSLFFSFLLLLVPAHSALAIPTEQRPSLSRRVSSFVRPFRPSVHLVRPPSRAIFLTVSLGRKAQRVQKRRRWRTNGDVRLSGTDLGEEPNGRRVPAPRRRRRQQQQIKRDKLQKRKKKQQQQHKKKEGNDARALLLLHPVLCEACAP